ncbi:hypothetical protein JF634_12405 [Simonsiella muelleri]|uniref:Holin n=1 Tax=Simonsiella muelleri ATCC 29453 TaxID=641147 RepID=V9H7M7_9NEIS|nr:hypothetical protein [Simonsiella muelleri]AUX61846.1 hypothetical protein BWP33_08545 [Simonsiella muelleri ATCC 29453]EFG30205.1 hypothetical protein HMPREF9021_01974 [Simonsiella muelleri ATCC 29453]UBQ53933.1 hypothetical protein JF634_12405 [Simonsiella muelleri]
MKYFELLILSIPSFGVCYLMICLVNAKKRSLWRLTPPSIRSWAYLMFFGGAIFSWYNTLNYGISPNFDKILMDVAALLYFGQRAWRILKWKNQKNKEVE